MAENKKSNEKRLILVDAHKLEELLSECLDVIKSTKPTQIPLLQSLLVWIGYCKKPTVDAVEVVHGYWIDSTTVDHMGRITGHGIDCSVCDSVFKDDSREVVKHWKERFKVCPFCGALMDGGNEDD